MGTNSEPGPGTILTKGAATDAIISASCRYNGSGQHRLWYWQTCVCVCVCEKVYVGLGQTCVYTVRLMEQDGGEVDYGGDCDFLGSAAPLACMHVYARVPFMCIWLHDLVLLQQDSRISHPSRAQNSGASRKVCHIWFPISRGAVQLDSNYAAFSWTKDVLVIWTTKNLSGWVLGKKGVHNREYGNAFRGIGNSKKKGLLSSSFGEG